MFNRVLNTPMRLPDTMTDINSCLANSNEMIKQNLFIMLASTDTSLT